MIAQTLQENDDAWEDNGRGDGVENDNAFSERREYDFNNSDPSRHRAGQGSLIGVVT